jgi:hypothetical protein
MGSHLGGRVARSRLGEGIMVAVEEEEGREEVVDLMSVIGFERLGSSKRVCLMT